jgi:peptide/nickel transport system permease protein
VGGVTFAYIGGRLLHGLGVVLAVTTVVFFATRFIGDPVRTALPITATEEQAEEYRRILGLDQPLLEQYATYLADVARLDFGESILYAPEPAASLVLDALPATLTLVVSSFALALLLGLPLGAIAALRPGSWIDNVVVTLSLAGLSMPAFWFAQLLILLFALRLGILPTSGSGSVSHIVLPMITLGVPLAGRISQLVRSSMLDELTKLYILAARARGLSSRAIFLRHLMRNVLVAISSFVTFEIARAFVGATLIAEVVFAYPGIGQLAIQAGKANDVVLLSAVVLIASILVVLLNLASDILRGLIDPRVRVAG